MHLLQDKGLSGHRRFLATVTFTQHESAPSEIHQRLGYDNGSACQVERKQGLVAPVLAFVSSARAAIPLGKGLICLLLQNHPVVPALGSTRYFELGYIVILHGFSFYKN